MINPNAMKGLFKPYLIKNPFNFQDLLDATGLSINDYLKIMIQDECSKSIDETCINTDCTFNYLRMHEDELYIEVMQEIQAERKAVEDKVKRDMEKYNGTKWW